MRCDEKGDGVMVCVMVKECGVIVMVCGVMVTVCDVMVVMW